MARKKKGGKRRDDDWSDDDGGGSAAQQPPKQQQQPEKQLSRKEKRLQKQQQKQQQTNDDKDDDDEEDDILALMGRGGGRRGGRRGANFDDDDDDDAPNNRKGKRQQQQKKKRGGIATFDDDDDEDEEEDESSDEEPPHPINKKLSKKQQKKQMGGLAAFADEDDEDDEDEPLMPSKKLSKKQQMKKREEMYASFGGFDDDDDDDDEEDPDDDDDDDDDAVEQVAFMIIDDDDDDKKKKKKDKKKDKKKKKDDEDEAEEEEDDKKKKKKDKKKDKKDKKKDKKEKGKKKKDSAEEEEEQPDAFEDFAHLGLEDEEEPEETPKVEEKKDEDSKSRKKSKFELQMEAALKKKDDEENDKQGGETDKLTAKERAKKRAAEEREAKRAEEERKAKEAEEARERAGQAGSDDEAEVFYGAPDDKAWTDKSHAQMEAEANANDKPDRSLTHGPDGKKLSNKERKRLLKAREAAQRAAEYEESAAKASREGAQFACSQTAVNEKDPQWENALDINIPNFSISAAGKILFKDAALTIGRGRRYGLVGPNGKGKSTLLKMIASGDLRVPPRIDFLYVEQEVVADDTPAVEAVLRADQKRWDLLAEEKALMELVDAGDEDAEKIDRLQKVSEELAAMGADSAEAKARRILFGLGFDMDMQTKPTKMFSGGWRMRISLARALFIEPTLLMLDEPTNHLDLNAVIWLDDYLQRWKKTLLVVSHDQDFLNSVCQEILHIEDLKLISYKGNYDSFKKAQESKFKQQVKAWEKQEKRLRELKRSGQSKAKAMETVKKNNKREPGAKSQRKQNDAVASGTETAATQELIKRPREYRVKLEFTEVAELSRPVMEVNQVHFRYTPKHPVIFDQIDFGIDMDSRICVVGPNGAGKSTLLKLLTGEVNPTKGDVRRNPRLRMGIYNQHFVDRLPMNKTPVEHLRDRFDDQDYQSVRNRLGKYGLEGHAHEVVMRDLSGGQKARVVFVELSLQRPHILLLDEPTNNLDIETIDALVDAINEFNGGIVVVTHDQRLIELCECTLWVVEKRGVTKWEAGFEDYKDTLLAEMEAQVEQEAAERRKKLEAAAAAKAEKLARLANKVKSTR